MSPAIHPQQHIPALAGIRIIAAWMIFFHHYAAYVEVKWLQPLFNEFYLYLSFFFVLSGFLTFHLYFKRFEIGQFDTKSYLIRRLARLYPIYLVLLFLTAALQWESIRAFGLSASLVQAFFADYKFSHIAQAWTLTVLLSFYLLVPLLFRALAKSKQAFWIVPVAMMILGLLLSRLNECGFMGSFLEGYQFTLVYTIFGRIFEFMIGMFGAHWYMNKPLLRAKAPVYTLVGGLVYILLVLLITGFQSAEFAYGIFHPLGMALHHLLLPFAIVSLLIGLSHERSMFARLLSSPLFVLLGNASYVFYLIHIGVIARGFEYLVSSNWVLIFLFINVLSVFLYKWVELPLVKLVYRFKN
jgi:peptidoglycan/LPS O-acetylase OafA/YrhL